jgi:hypothetical protein
MPKTVTQSQEVRDAILDMQRQQYEVAATGCLSIGGYRQYARKRGYKHVRALQNSSSAGDWEFIVSKNGIEWYVMRQENRWPRAGFERHIEDQPFFGTAEEVLEQIYELYYRM